jgi:hypothetical protein
VSALGEALAGVEEESEDGGLPCSDGPAGEVLGAASTDAGEAVGDGLAGWAGGEDPQPSREAPHTTIHSTVVFIPSLLPPRVPYWQAIRDFTGAPWMRGAYRRQRPGRSQSIPAWLLSAAAHAEVSCELFEHSQNRSTHPSVLERLIPRGRECWFFRGGSQRSRVCAMMAGRTSWSPRSGLLEFSIERPRRL